MSIEITVKNSYSKISGLEDLPTIDLISKALSYQAGYITWTQKQGGWDGSYRLLTKRLQFPSGCLDRVCELLTSFNLPYKIIDKRIYSTPSGVNNLEWTGFELYDYQKKIIEACIDHKWGMVKACTGSGKSLMLSRLVYEYNLPTVIYAVSTDLVQQLHETLSASINQRIGIVGDGKCDIQRITVCSVWTAGRAYNKKIQKGDEDISPDNWSPSQAQRQTIRDMVESAELCILDEAQFAGADSIKQILANSHSAAHRFGLSGSPWRNAGDDILLEAAFGKRIYDLTSSELIRQGYLVPAHIVFKDIPKLDIASNMKYAAVEKHYIVENEVRNRILINATLKLLDMGRKPLVLFRKHKHGRLLRDMLPPDVNFRYVTGKVGSEERHQVRDDFKAGKVDLVLASTIFDQGIDLVALDALIPAGGGKSSAKAIQRVGRVIRGNKEGGKKDSIVVETFDQAQYLRKHSYARWLIYNTEDEFKFKTGKEFASYVKRMKRYGSENN